MTLNEYLNVLEDNDPKTYYLASNLQMLTYALGKQLKCQKDELKLLYSISSLYYLDEFNFSDISKDDVKMMKHSKTFLNSKNINFLKQKIELIILICSCYNDLRNKNISHEEAFNIVINHERIPVIVKNAFREVINKDKLYCDLSY